MSEIQFYSQLKLLPLKCLYYVFIKGKTKCSIKILLKIDILAVTFYLYLKAFYF